VTNYLLDYIFFCVALFLRRQHRNAIQNWKCIHRETHKHDWRGLFYENAQDWQQEDKATDLGERPLNVILQITNQINYFRTRRDTNDSDPSPLATTEAHMALLLVRKEDCWMLLSYTTSVILVYDITKRNTFLSLQKWITEVRSYTASNVVCALVGNKCDLLEEREVSEAEAEEVCGMIPELLFKMETSAKQNTNIENAFIRIAEELMNRQGNIDDDDKGADGIKLGKSQSVAAGNCSC